MVTYTGFHDVNGSGFVTAPSAGSPMIGGTGAMQGTILPYTTVTAPTVLSSTTAALPPGRLDVAKRDVREAKDALFQAERRLKSAYARIAHLNREILELVEPVIDAAQAIGGARARLAEAQRILHNTALAAEATSGPVPDIPGRVQRPDPTGAGTAAELMQTLRAYRTWAGNPSYRQMAGRAEPRASYSALHAVLKTDKLPSQDFVAAIVTGCGGNEQDKQLFVAAWREIAMASDHTDPGQARYAATA
jgi:hypothetical protein